MIENEEIWQSYVKFILLVDMPMTEHSNDILPTEWILS